MSNFDTIAAELARSLTELALKRTSVWVENRIRTSQNTKDNQQLRNIYEEIVSELLHERDEAVRIAQAYKSELDRMIISDEDIKHLDATIDNILKIFREYSPTMPMDAFIQFRSLINADTLKTMQLLGFNYKAAIGEPLTEICATAIRALTNKKTTKTAVTGGSTKNVTGGKKKK